MHLPTFRRLPAHLGAWGLGVCLAGLSLAAEAASTGPASSTSPSATTAAPTSACTDFYAHVNADWLAGQSLPPNRSRIGTFDELRVANDRRLEQALQRLLADPARQDTPGLKLLATWYASGLDPAHSERQGLKPARALLDRIDALAASPAASPAATAGAPSDRSAAAVPAPAALAALLGELTRYRLGTPMELWVGPDTADVRRHVLTIGQGGLGLPDRDDYFKTDDTSRRLQAAYRRHAARLLALSGAAHDDATLDALLAFETALAQATKTVVERRDPKTSNHRVTLARLPGEAPGFDWATWIATAGAAPGEAELILSAPRLAAALGDLAGRTPVPVWQAYLRVRLLDHLAPWLPEAYRQAHFEYHDRTQRGLQQPASRHEQLIALIAGRTGWEPLSQTVGELFVRDAFSPRAQARADRMIEDVRAAMAARIRQLDWMGPATRERALAKLAAMTPQIGAPTRWPDYTGLALDPADPAGNALRVSAWSTARDHADWPRPVDRTRWQSSPHIVNAFAASQNRIVFPAGILQPPFFDAEGDDAANYGGIGMVIGHEITHHFDDRGRQYDAAGNLADWWTPEDDASYRARADRVVALYGRFEPLPGLRLNGRQMLGENISDLGGLQIAFDAYQIAQRRQPGAVIDGWTPAQRFFRANAVIWRAKQRAESLEQQIRTGQHSPSPYRVVGPMAQMPEFAAAFGCRAGDPMVATDPVAVW